MDNVKELVLEIIVRLKRKLSKPESVLNTLLVAVLFLFFLQRLYSLMFFITACVCYLMAFKLFTRLPGHLVMKAKLVALVLLLLFGLVLSCRHTRLSSWDGQLWYIPRVISLRNGVPLNILNTAHPPYLAEIILAFVLKVSSFSFVSVALYLSALANILLIYYLYKCQGYIQHKGTLIYVVVLSPVYLSMMFIEFKVEHLLLNAGLLAFIAFYRQSRRPSFLNSFFLGLFLAAAVLVKVSVIPLFVALLAIGTIKDLLDRRYGHLPYRALSAFIMVAIVLLWVITLGINIPWTGINFSPKNLTPTVVFDKDPEVYLKCLNESKNIDFSQFLYYYPDKIRVLFQPIAYLLDPVFVGWSEGVGILDPGPIMYFSIIAFVPLVLLNKVLRKDPVFLSSLLYVIWFFIDVQGIFWYIFILYPILVVPSVGKTLDLFASRSLVRSVCIILGLMYLLMTVHFAFSVLRNPDWGAHPVYHDNIKVSSLLNSLDGLILDTSPKPSEAFITFVEDYHHRVVKDQLYFGYTNKSYSDIFEELRSYNIRYLVVLQKQTIVREKVAYYGCPKVNALRAIEFSSLYGKLIYGNEETGVMVYSLW